MNDTDLIQNLCGLMFDHSVTEDSLQGYVSEQDVDRLLDMHAALSMSSYSVRTSHINEGGRLTWLPNGYPGRKLSITVKQCHFGPLYYQSGKKNENKRFHDGEMKKPNSKKKDCSAKVVIRKVEIFEDYKINLDDLPKQQCTKRLLKRERLDSIKSAEGVAGPRVVYYTELPLLTAHSGHGFTDTEGQVNRVHHRIIEKAQQLAREGLTDVKQVKNIISHFVETDLKTELPERPREGDRRYHPLERDITGSMRRALSSMHFDHLDQDNLEELIHIWAQHDESNQFFLRKCISQKQNASNCDEKLNSGDVIDTDSNYNSFLFVHQNNKQRALLSEYGNQIVLFDATYKTTKHAPPLFQLSVKTPTQYKIVAMFIIETGPEVGEHVVEALTILRSWNMDWAPACILTHYCDDVTAAIEQFFSDINTRCFMCQSQRVQCWEKWIKDHKLGVGARKRLSALFTGLTQVSHYQSTVSPHQLYHQALDRLKQDEIWQTNENLQDWFTTDWLSRKEQWSLYFVDANTSRYINSDLKCEQEFLKSSFQKKLRGKELSALIQVLIETYLPSVLGSEETVVISDAGVPSNYQDVSTDAGVIHSNHQDSIKEGEATSQYVLDYDYEMISVHSVVGIPESLNTPGAIDVVISQNQVCTQADNVVITNHPPEINIEVNQALEVSPDCMQVDTACETSGVSANMVAPLVDTACETSGVSANMVAPLVDTACETSGVSAGMVAPLVDTACEMSGVSAGMVAPLVDTACETSGVSAGMVAPLVDTACETSGVSAGMVAPLVDTACETSGVSAGMVAPLVDTACETSGVSGGMVAPLVDHGQVVDDIAVKQMTVSDICQDIMLLASQCNDSAALQLLIDNLSTSKDILLGTISC